MKKNREKSANSQRPVSLDAIVLQPCDWRTTRCSCAQDGEHYRIPPDQSLAEGTLVKVDPRSLLSFIVEPRKKSACPRYLGFSCMIGETTERF